MGINQVKILCLFSSPLIDEDGDPVDLLDIVSEKEAILNELSASNRTVTIRIGFATTQTLAHGIRDGFNILHFSGHGNKQYLIFEDGKGGCHLVKGAYLKKLIGVAGPFDVAMISSCFSEPIARMVQKAGVRHVIGIRRDSPILDCAATKFATAFYGNLVSNDTIQRSFDLAKIIVEGDPDLSKLGSAEKEDCRPSRAEHQKFVLLPLNSPSFHQQHIFDSIPEGILKIEEITKAPTNIPVRPRSFRGRSQEMHQIINELFENRLVTLTGAGGIGKTTIAMEIARWFHVRGHFKDGIYTLDLREATDSNRIIDLLGACVGTPLANINKTVEYLQEKSVLLILDNAEELLFKDQIGIKGLIDQILMYSARVKILLTSQRPIGNVLYEPEQIFRIPVMSPSDSIQLFLASSRRPIDRMETKSIEFKGLLGRLGGHSLSIVLMAKQLNKGMEIGELIYRIDKNKATAIQANHLSNKSSDHGKSLRASLLSSFENLAAPAKEFFLALTMLPAGISEDNCESIFGEKSWGLAQQLNDASLAEIDPFGRIVLLPPVRLFAEEMQTEDIRQKYGQRIVHAMASCSAQIYDDIGTANSLNAIFNFTLNEPNMLEAISLPYTYINSKQHQASPIAQLCYNMVEFYCFADRNESGALTIEQKGIRTLEKIGDNLGIGLVLNSLGYLEHKIGNNIRAEEKFVNALKIFKAEKNELQEANTQLHLGTLYLQIGKCEQSESSLTEALCLYKKHKALNGQANTLQAFGSFYMKSDISKAMENLKEAIRIFRKVKDENGQASALFVLGELYLNSGKNGLAESNLKEALQLCEKIRYSGGKANVLAVLSELHMRSGKYEDAENNILEALEIFRKFDIKVGLANSLHILGLICLAMNRPKEGINAFFEALQIYQQIGDVEGVKKIGNLILKNNRRLDSKMSE